MPSNYVHTEINGHRIKLSNLQKIIYPGTGIRKAEVIKYYLDASSFLLPFIAHRPLTLIRFPDGINNDRFYAKNKPDWTPKWIASYKIDHSDNPVNYLVVEDDAAVAWLANLAALELHPMQMTIDQINHPDHFIFDLDPPDDHSFDHVKEVAHLLRTFLEGYGYHPFIKTSGGKGLHIYVPIVKTPDHETVTSCVKALAKVFVEQTQALTTLNLSKDKRENKILIDIMRNHKAHTTVAPFSLRGKPGAPVSMPFFWEDLAEVPSSGTYTLLNWQSYIDENGNAWKDFFDTAVQLHTLKNENFFMADPDGRLDAYREKRNFDQTPEPLGPPVPTGQNRYCIQLHDAQNLHYDLRLEDKGTLWSWAIPKGMPWKKGEKRLAIRTEDHPLQYLTFEGIIPKGQYGAGSMWVFENGTVTWHKKEETSLSFTLNGGGRRTRYNLFKTKDDHWIIKMSSNQDPSSFISTIQLPMLASSSRNIPSGRHYQFEIKWDGIRALIYVDEDNVKVYSRNGQDLSRHFPEMLNMDYFNIESGIFDGEIVCLDKTGKPEFHQVISRMHQKSDTRIQSKMKSHPVTCYLFDCLFLDGKTIIDEPQARRYAWTNVSIKKNKVYRMSEALPDGKALFEASGKLGLEGIMAKDTRARYSPGQRSAAWIKIKHRNTEICHIAGYTKGEGDRSALFGALHLVRDNAGQWVYMGKVGTGFDTKKMKQLLKSFQDHVSVDKPFKEKTDDDKDSIWLKPKLKCTIEYASLSVNGTYREPIFLKLE